MRVRKLQCKLIHDVIYMRRNGREPGGWEDTLKEYSKYQYPLFDTRRMVIGDL